MFFCYSVFLFSSLQATRQFVYQIIVLLLLCLSFTLSTRTRQLVNSSTRLPSNRSPVTLSSTYPVYKQLVNLSTRYLVYQVIVLLLLCLSSTLSTSNSLTRLLVNLSTKQTLLYLLFFL